MTLKVKIIRGGIAGLIAGWYPQMSGLFTSRGKMGYRFYGCIYWLHGSAKDRAFYRLWSGLLNMNSIPFINHKLRISIEVIDHAINTSSK